MIKAIIRPMDLKKDMDGALRCFNEGFAKTRWPHIRHAGTGLHKDALTYFYKMSTDHFAAEVDGEICGIILGAVPLRIKKLIHANIFYYLYMIPKTLLNVYGMNRLAFKHGRQMVSGYLPYTFHQPQRWPRCEVILFTMSNKYRGQGIGRGLMDRLVDLVCMGGHEGIYVWTDTALTYRFYESYGFQLEKSFDMKAYKYSIPNKSFTGLIYYYKIPDK